MSPARWWRRGRPARRHSVWSSSSETMPPTCWGASNYQAGPTTSCTSRASAGFRGQRLPRRADVGFVCSHQREPMSCSRARAPSINQWLRAAPDETLFWAQVRTRATALAAMVALSSTMRRAGFVSVTAQSGSSRRDQDLASTAGARTNRRQTRRNATRSSRRDLDVIRGQRMRADPSRHALRRDRCSCVRLPSGRQGETGQPHHRLLPAAQASRSFGPGQPPTRASSARLVPGPDGLRPLRRDGVAVNAPRSGRRWRTGREPTPSGTSS